MNGRQSNQDAAIAGVTNGQQIRAKEFQRSTPSTLVASPNSRWISGKVLVKMIAATGWHTIRVWGASCGIFRAALVSDQTAGDTL